MIWRVETATGSTYVLDLRAMTLTRVPADSGEPLRRDGEPIAVMAIEDPTPQIGRPLWLVLDLRGDGILTERFTSPVMSVEAVE